MPLRNSARLAALAATGLSDSPPEEAFDRLTRLTRRCLRVPVALVSLVDADRQFFKSQQGLPEPWCWTRETPLSHSFCQHVVARDEPLIVDDARENPLVRDNLAVSALSVIAYLGVPLRTASGHVLGSLCAIDSVPRVWTDADREIMEAIAELVMDEISASDQRRQDAGELWGAVDRARALFLALFEGIPQWTALLDPEGAVVEGNSHLLAAINRQRGDVVGSPLVEVLGVSEMAAGRLAEAIGRARYGEVVQYDEAVSVGEQERSISLTLRSVPGLPDALLFEGR